MENAIADFPLHAVEASVMFVDVAESVRHVQRNEAVAVTQIRRLLDHASAKIVPRFTGRVVDRAGDGILVQFSAARDAVHCAVALHELAQNDVSQTFNTLPMQLRIGIHASDVLTDDRAVYGHGVHLAARIAAFAAPGETMVTAEVRDRLTPELDPGLEDMGEFFLKHIDEPVRAYRVMTTENKSLQRLLPRSGVETRSTEVPQSLKRAKPSLAIIPPTCAAPDSGDRMLAQVLADDLIATISKCEFIDVISRLSSQAFMGREHSLESVGCMLGCDYVATGSYRVVGNVLDLSFELAQVRSGMVIWAEHFSSPMHATWFGDTDLVDRLSRELLDQLVEAEIGVVRHCALANVTDYSLLLGAISLMYRTQRTDFQRSRQALEHLAERHPRVATPYAWLAKWHVFKVTQGWFENLDVEAHAALNLASRALAIDPSHDTALTVSGLVATNMKKDPAAGAMLCERALAVNPNNALALLYRGLSHAFQGNGEEALVSAHQAMRLSPLDPHRFYYQSLAATAALAAKEWKLALQLAEASRRTNRLHTSTLRVIAIASIETDDIARAREAVSEVLRIDPTLTVANYLSRSPARDYAVGQSWANALQRAGVPA